MRTNKEKIIIILMMIDESFSTLSSTKLESTLFC
jgi:hypothetical protein